MVFLFSPLYCSVRFAQAYVTLAPSFAFVRLVVKSWHLLNFVQPVVLDSLYPSLKLYGHVTRYFAQLLQ